MFSKSARVVVDSGFIDIVLKIPALFTKIFTFPKAFNVSDSDDLTESSETTSVFPNITSGPNSLASFSPRAASVSQIATLLPKLLKSLTADSPKPDAPPVITVTAFGIFIFYINNY